MKVSLPAPQAPSSCAMAAEPTLPPIPTLPPLSCSPFIAAGTYGRGRVVAFGHEAMLAEADLSSSLGRLVRNSVQWAAGGKAAGVRVATNDGGWANGLLARMEGWNDTLSFGSQAPTTLPANEYGVEVYIAK